MGRGITGVVGTAGKRGRSRGRGITGALKVNVQVNARWLAFCTCVRLA